MAKLAQRFEALADLTNVKYTGSTYVTAAILDVDLQKGCGVNASGNEINSCPDADLNPVYDPAVFTMTQKLYQKSQTFELPIMARHEDSLTGTDDATMKAKSFKYQDDAQYFTHNIYLANDAEKTAHCADLTVPATHVSCFTFLAAAHSAS